MNLSRRNFLSLLGISPISVNLFGQIENSNIFGRPFTTVYKVVSPGKFSFQSYFLPNNAIINYNKKGVIKPTFGQIFVFDSLNKARLYCIGVSRYKCPILKCKTKDYQKGKMFHLYMTDTFNSLKQRWDNNGIKKDNSGTIFCNSLEVIGEVE